MTGVYLNVNFSLTSASFPSNRSKSFIARLESFLLTPERLVIIDMYFHTSFKTWGKQQKSVTSKTHENKRVVFVGKISLSNPKQKDNLQCIAGTWTQSASIDFRGINVEYIWFKRLFLLLFEWFRFKWPFNTGGKQHKQAVGTWSKVKITVRNGKKLWDFSSRPPNTRRPLNTVSLNTGSTEHCKSTWLYLSQETVHYLPPEGQGWRILVVPQWNLPDIPIRPCSTLMTSPSPLPPPSLIGSHFSTVLLLNSVWDDWPPSFTPWKQCESLPLPSPVPSPQAINWDWSPKNNI